MRWKTKCYWPVAAIEILETASDNTYIWVCLKETNQRPDRSFADKCVRVKQVKVIGAAIILCNPKREIVAVRKAAISRRLYEGHPGGPGILLDCFGDRRRIS